MKLLKILIPLTLFLVLLSQFAKADQKTLSLSHLNSSKIDNATGVMANRFKDALAQDPSANFSVEVYPEGQLGSDRDMVKLVQDGVIQSAIVTVGGVAPIFPEIGVLNVPFLFQNLEDAYRSFDGKLGQVIAEKLMDRTGLHILGYGDSGGLFVLTNSKRPIKSVRDMKGLTIRTMNLEGHKAVIKNLGAFPAAIPWGELYPALKSKAVDGQMNPPSIIQLGNLDEAQRYMTMTNHLYTPYFWIANDAFMKSLTGKEKRAIAKAASQAVLANRAFIAKSTAIEDLSQSMEIHYPTTGQLNGFKIASQQKIENYLNQTLGEEGLKLLRIARGQ